MSSISTTLNHQVTISNFIRGESRESIITEIYNDLNARHRSISSKYFYDDLGSSLFEEITTLYEYYPARTEKSILRHIAPEILKDIDGLDIIELGSGDCSKISILLDTVPSSKINRIRYIPVDVSEMAILKSAELLSYNYPGLPIHGLVADFIKHLNGLPGIKKRLICFFGSTIGNLGNAEACQFLSNIRKLMRPGDCLLVGFDLVKDQQILEAAYNDPQGITAAFNKNILEVVNRIAETNIYPDLFEHIAFYNPGKSRIEMHLRAIQEMVIESRYFPDIIHLEKGDSIHTENSHKYTTKDIQGFGTVTGLHLHNIYMDAHQWFGLGLFKLLN